MEIIWNLTNVLSDFVEMYLSCAYDADSKKQVATPKKKAANTIRSATLAFDWRRYTLLYA